MTRQVHVVGAGLAGLAAALRLSGRRDVRVTLWEATARAGGRCRSFHDNRLGRTLDNGNHLILSGNRNVLDYAQEIGGVCLLEPLDAAALPFVDLVAGRRWTLAVPRGLRGGRLPPGTGPRDLVGLLRLLVAGADASVASAVGRGGPFWRAFWEPLTLAVLNTPPETASARLLRAALRRTLLRGAGACRPVLAPEGLGAALVSPAVARLEERGVAIRFRARLGAVEVNGGAASALRLADGGHVPLGPRDSVVLALPPQALAALCPHLAAAPVGQSILNAHFRVDASLAAEAPPLTGLLGGSAQWIFRRGDVLSVTVSAAEASPVSGLSRQVALETLWRDVARALGRPAARPLAGRLLRERGATFDQSVAGVARRAPMRTPLANVMLAGDHVDHGLPATLEAAVVSGRAAADALLARRAA